MVIILWKCSIHMIQAYGTFDFKINEIMLKAQNKKFLTQLKKTKIFASLNFHESTHFDMVGYIH